MKRELIAAVGLLLIPLTNLAQQSKVLPWRPSSNDVPARTVVYHPEPVLLVHGINGNDALWTNAAMPALQIDFQKYDLPFGATQLTGVHSNFNARQENFLHTFNYGDPPGTNTLNCRAFEHIEWNTLDSDMRNRYFTNIFVKSTDPGYIQAVTNFNNRQPLDLRIQDIRSSYAMDPIDTNTWPSIVLVAHSSGAEMAHYYLLRKPTDHGARRLVTLAGTYQRSDVANGEGILA